MATFQRISIDEAKRLLDESCQLVDIRDPASWREAHIPGARHIDNDTLRDFLQEADRSRPLIVYCYHGNSSQSAAQYFAEQAFAEVYSMDGGFEAWRQQFPIER